MKNEKNQNYSKQNKINKIEIQKSKNSISPKPESKYKKISKISPKKGDSFPKDLLENTRKYIEMSNGNNSYLISPLSSKTDISAKYTSPSLGKSLAVMSSLIFFTIFLSLIPASLWYCCHSLSGTNPN